MKKVMAASLLIVGLMTGCDSTTDSESEENENSVLHSQGVSCATCHSAGSEESFTSGATVFTTLDAANSDTSKYATGYGLRLLLAGGSAVTYSSGRGIGNFYTRTSTGTFNDYTAQVVDSSGVVVNSSNTDSHDLNRLDCNSCHTAAGTGGAPGRIHVGITTTPTTPTIPASASLSTDVMPILEAKCKSCHGSTSRRTFKVMATATDTLTNLTTNSLLDLVTASNSRLLQKGSDTVSHDGGRVIATTSVEYQTIEQWIAAGASNN